MRLIIASILVVILMNGFMNGKRHDFINEENYRVGQYYKDRIEVMDLDELLEMKEDKKGNNSSRTLYKLLDVIVFEPCDVNCNKCSKEVVCNICNDGYYRVIGKPNVCWNEVLKEKNYYLNSENKYDLCYESCESCFDKGDYTDNKCESCLLTEEKRYYQVIDKKNQCWTKDRKEDRYYFNEDTLIFENCYLTCKTCSQGGFNYLMNCLTCFTEKDYYPVEGDILGICWDKNTINPDSGYFFNSLTSRFERCFAACSSCSDKGNEENMNCVKCKNKFFKVQNREGLCWDSMIKYKNYYKDETLKLFIKCFESCEECTESGTQSSPKCLSCLLNYYPLDTNPSTCWNNLIKPPNYYLTPENTYSLCHPSCHSCLTSGTSSSPNCIKCSASFYPVFSNPSTCWNDSTKDPNYFLWENSSYKQCDPSCLLSCSITSTNCDQCASGYFPCETDASQCWNNLTHPPNYILINGIYIKCDPSCLSCFSKPSSSNTNCLSCDTSKAYYPQDTSSSSNCLNNASKPSNYYLDSASSPPIYKQCYHLCKTCTEGGDDSHMNCKECLGGFYPVKDLAGMCWNELSKDVNYYLSDGDYYDKCFKSCASCSKGGDALETNCLSCLEDGGDERYYPNEKDGSMCWNDLMKPLNYYFDYQALMYKKCDLSCESCSDRKNGEKSKCKECNEEESYIPVKGESGRCLNEETKEDNYFINDENEYEKCFIACGKCDHLGNEGLTGCISCANALGYYFQKGLSGQCVNESTKPVNYYFDEDTRQYEQCYSSCHSCSVKGIDDNHNCHQCASHYLPLRPTPTNCFNSETKKRSYVQIGNYYEICYDTCSECLDIGTPEKMYCKFCIENHYPIENSLIQCYNDQTKPYATFLDHNTKVYNHCHKLCITCTEKGNEEDSKCLQCLDGYYHLKDKPTHCITKEIQEQNYPNYVFDSAMEMFEKCHDTCKFCNILGGNALDHKCSTCLPYHYPIIDKENQCHNESTKPHNYYLNKSLLIYTKCYLSCYDCNEPGDDNDHKCLTCDNANQYYLMNTTPLPKCIHLTEKPLNYYLDSNTMRLLPCLASCGTCNAYGNPYDTKCLTCAVDYYLMKENPSQCFNTKNKPGNVFLNANDQYELCEISCASCNEKGNSLGSKCLECALDYYPLATDQSSCYNEMTKPPNTQLNPDNQYEECNKNVLCNNRCDSLTQRWFLNQYGKIECIIGKTCNAYAPYYHEDFNQCLTKCPESTITDIITNSCIQCSLGSRPYLYKGACYSKCPDGSVLNYQKTRCFDCPAELPYYLNGNCILECPISSSIKDNLCQPCDGFYDKDNHCVDKCPEGEDYDSERRCIPRKNIDDSITIDHNPIDYDNEILDYFKKHKTDAEIQETLGKMITSINQGSNVGSQLNQLILFAEMVQYTSGKSHVYAYIQAIYGEAVDLFCHIIQDNIIDIEVVNHDEITLLLLGQFYLLINHLYITKPAFERIKGAQLKLVTILSEYLDTIDKNSTHYKGYRGDIFSLYFKTLTQMNEKQHLYNADDPTHNRKLFSNLFYRMKKLFLVDDSRLLMRDIIQRYSTFTIELTYPSHIIQMSDKINFVNMPINTFTTNSTMIEVIYKCIEDEEIIAMMKENNMLIEVCLPKPLQDNGIIAEIAMIQYKGQYPLYNKNITESHRDFLNVQVYSKTYDKLTLSSFNTGAIKLYFDTGSEEYGYCSYYNDYDKRIGEGCTSKHYGKYVVCECEEFGDYGVMKVDPYESYKNGNFLFTKIRLINSRIPFEELFPDNGLALYLFFGILLVYLVLLIIVIYWDCRKNDDMIFISKDMKIASFFHEQIIMTGIVFLKNILEEKELLKQKLLLLMKKENQIIPIVINIQRYNPNNNNQTDKTEGVSSVKTSKPLNEPHTLQFLQSSIENASDSQTQSIAKDQAQAQAQDQPQAQAQPILIVQPGTKAQPQAESIEIKKSNSQLISSSDSKETTDAPKPPSIDYSLLLMEFFYNEYRPFILFSSNKHNIIKSHMLTLFFLRKILLLTLSGMISSCRPINSAFELEVVDYIYIFGCIVIVDIFYTGVEELLARRNIANENDLRKRRMILSAYFSLIIFYIITVVVFVFGVINTTWVTLVFENQELTSMVYFNYGLVILVDLILYEPLVLCIKAWIYKRLLMYYVSGKHSLNFYKLLRWMTVIPWLFDIRWNLI